MIKKFDFIVEHVSSSGEVTTIFERNFGMPFVYKPRVDTYSHGFPTEYEEGVFENSYHAVELSTEIFELLRMILKDASMDYVQKHSLSPIVRNKEYENAQYRVRIVDLQYPIRDFEGYCTDQTVKRDIFNFSFSAYDFVEYNPNFVPHFWKVWKDFSNYRADDPTNNVSEDGVTKLSMYKGIRTLIKKYLGTNHKDFVNRFTTVSLEDSVNNFYMI